MLDVERTLADLYLEDAEEDKVVEFYVLVSAVGESLENNFMGSFLTTSVVNFQSMRLTLANIWHPIGGITITNLYEGRFLYRLYHKVDADRIEIGWPWNFNSHLLVLYRLHDGGDP